MGSITTSDNTLTLDNQDPSYNPVLTTSSGRDVINDTESFIINSTAVDVFSDINSVVLNSNDFSIAESTYINGTPVIITSNVGFDSNFMVVDQPILNLNVRYAANGNFTKVII